jgi:hypothetical protein
MELKKKSKTQSLWRDVISQNWQDMK